MVAGYTVLGIQVIVPGVGGGGGGGGGVGGGGGGGGGGGTPIYKLYGLVFELF